MADPTEPHCVFCRKAQSEVRRIIGSPGGVYICDECITLCYDICRPDTEEEEAMPGIFGEDGDNALDQQAADADAQASVAGTPVFPLSTGQIAAGVSQLPYDPGGGMMAYGTPPLMPEQPSPLLYPPVFWPAQPSPAPLQVLTPTDRFESLVLEMYLVLTRRPLNGGAPLTEPEREWCAKAGELISASIAAKRAALSP